ncbi:Motile sperm domain-containing protein 2, variant 4 [Dermatophagoides farinae]|uniref:Motile sperm domain-containing protein 2, variant 4 n=1 Tax=Dermatophagoides farinae TaxID=6954 RepID=A0A922HSA7_DERFA|nr:Motile sperm domain-containing protein 2, variant 4 [Dermatophagoides farinae]
MSLKNQQQQIHEIRSIVLEQYEKHPELYDSIDIEWIQNDDWPIEECIHYDGNELLFIRVKCYYKIRLREQIFRNFILFQMERCLHRSHGHGITMIVDFNGFSYANIDLDFIIWGAKLLTKFCPKSLKRIVCYDMSRIVIPFYNIFKRLLSDEIQQRLRFWNDDEIFKYIDRNNLPRYLGGTCHHYRNVPTECQSIIDYGHDHDWSDNDIGHILKLIKPNLDESEMFECSKE